MKTIAYMVGGSVLLQAFADDNAQIDFEYIVLTEIPVEPIESWYIEDGAIKIDQQKLMDFNRSRMSALDPVKFELMLDTRGLYDAVQNIISLNRPLKTYYTRSIEFKRLDSYLDQLRIALGITDEQVDAMWSQALQP